MLDVTIRMGAAAPSRKKLVLIYPGRAGSRLMARDFAGHLRSEMRGGKKRGKLDLEYRKEIETVIGRNSEDIKLIKKF